ncbi:helix-turn-helix domain-containing protein [Nocardia vermiculata]|uniref:Helix-turn-helix domain-containing protein n=1 Tax=Nocardia vermiculata TaxID=257274 RepID=A0A846XYM4_9NOCA|nr:helix-turn-helix domain-containing protein [Nocardia vermiculata]NKY50168.1 helix-turn-helix domain-containing protein [Nocardia vermiculata]
MANRSTYLTLHDVAAEYGVHINTARRWAANGDLPCVRIGKSYYVHPDDLERLRPGGAAAMPEPVAAPVGREAFADYIAKVVAEAPPLTSDQVAKISTLLGSKAVA